MPIPFTCPFCEAHTLVDESFAGQSGPCGQCGATITVPVAFAIASQRSQRSQRSEHKWPRRALFVSAGLLLLVATGGVVVVMSQKAADNGLAPVEEAYAADFEADDPIEFSLDATPGMEDASVGIEGVPTPLAADILARQSVPPRDDTSPAPEKFLIARLVPQSRETLGRDLKRKISEAKALGLRPFVEVDTRAASCVERRELDEHLADDEMIDAFAGTFIIRIGLRYWGDPSAQPKRPDDNNPYARPQFGGRVPYSKWRMDEDGNIQLNEREPAPTTDPIADVALEVVEQEGALPAFYELNDKGFITDRVIGANAWRGDMAPSLKKFFQTPWP